MRYLVSLVIAVILIVVAFRVAQPLPDTGHDESFLPKATSVRYLSLGHDATAAGFFWIMGLTDLGESYYTGKEYNYLSHVADISTSLDSLFYTPYYFVGALTPQDATDTTDFHVMRKAIRIYPDDWRMALGFALRLSQGAYPDKKAAADVMRPFLNSPDTTIPNHIRVIHRIFELDTMQTEIALESILNDVTKPTFRKFRESFYGKIYRLLGYRNLFEDKEHDPVYIAIKTAIDDYVAEKISFQQAYFYLLQQKKPEEQKPEKTEASESRVASSDSLKVEQPPADSLAQDSASAQ